ncbi:Myc-type, basic helix-loop-helix domain-containing protein [Tanacetum coccineum]
MKRQGKGFSGRVTPLFQTMMVQAHEEMGEGSEIPTDPHHTPIITQPSSSQPQRKQKSRKSKKNNTKVPQPSRSTDNVPDENVPTTSNDLLLSGEDRLKLTELLDLCTNLQKKVLDLEKAKTAQDSEIASLKKKVKTLERRNKSRTPGLKRLRKVGSARRVESFDEASLVDQEDASKQGRKIADIDANAEVTLIDETQGRNDDNLMFDTGVLDEQEVKVKKVVSTAKVTTESATTTIVDELTLAQTLIEIKAAKPKVRGVMIQEPSEFTTTTTTTPAASKPSQDKGKAKMIESEKPLKKKDQIMYDQEDNTQAMMDADYQMAQQLQAEEQEQLSIEEKSKLFVQLLEARKKHFAEMRAREKRSKPPTQAQQRKLYCNYLKNMEGYTLKQLKGFKFKVIKDMFDKSFKRVNTFVDYKTELVEGSEKRAEDNTKRAGTELEQEVAKKQKIDDAKVDDDQEEARMKELMNIVPDKEEVAINAIPLATKPPCIVDWKIIKEGKISQFHIIRADGSSKRYSTFIYMLRNFEREDLETLWKLVKAKHGSTRLEEGYERVLWGDLMTMFKPDVESLVWRTLQNEKVLIWKLFDSCGVHFLRLQSMHIFMLVEKRYPLTPATITIMLNKKLQADHWHEIKVGRVVLRLFDLVRTGIIVAGPMDGAIDYANTGTIRLRRDQRVLAMVDGLPSLRVADSHTGNHSKDDFTPLETIRRSYSVIREKISFELKGETFEPERRVPHQVFNSHEDLKTWAQNKARPLGYVIITKRTKANTSGFTYKIDLKCDLSGEYKEKESSKDTSTRKTNCPFMLVRKYSWVYNSWVLSVICDEHNHPPAQHMEVHPYARRLTTREYRLVEDLTRKNVAARKILAIIKEQNKDNVSTIKDIYNAQSKIRKAEKVGQITMQNLMSLLHFNGALSYLDEQWLNNHKEKFVSAWADHSLNFGEYIPLDSIVIFWRTLNVPWSEPVENEDIQCDDVLHLFKEKFNEQSNVVKKSLLRKLLDIVNPSKTVIKEPPIKKNTRGRPSLKKQQEKKRAGPKTQDLGRTSNLIPDLNEEPPRHSSFVSQTSMWHDSSIDEQIEIERLRKQIPKVVHPYISVSGIQNVGSDGNCGFRAVALGLGLPEDHWPRISTVKFAGRWMEMPDTGLVIASAYNKVVVNLSDAGGCNTSFPLWSRPPQTESHETIVVAHVDGNHYISVALREDFPLPLTHPLWITYRSDVASGWEDKFVSRQNEFREYYYRTPESYDLT